MKTFSFLGLLTVTLSLAACGDVSTPGECTLIGCTDQLNVELGAIGNKFASSLPITLSICVDDKGCEAFVVEAVGGALQCRADGGETLGSCSLDAAGNVTVIPAIGVGGKLAAGSHDVALTVKDKDGTTLAIGSGKAVLKENRPNGPGCDPVCIQGSVTFPP
jgi:hypothetical protein